MAKISKKGRKIGRWKRKDKQNNAERNKKVQLEARLRKLRKRHPNTKYTTKNGKTIRQRNSNHQEPIKKEKI